MMGLKKIIKQQQFIFLLWLLAAVSCNNTKDKQQDTTTANNAIAKTEGPAKYQFTLQLKAGSKYYYTIINETVTTIEADNKTISNSNESTVGLLYEVVKNMADTVTVKLTYDKLHIVYKSADGKQVIDADNAAESQDEVERVLSHIKGSSLLVTFTKKGNIINVTGSKEINDKVLAGLLYDDEATKRKVQAQLSKLIGDDFVKGNIGQSLSFYPDSAITEGTSWVRNSTQPGEINFDAVTKYTLASVDDDKVVIETSSKLSTGKSAISVAGQKVDADIKGNTEGFFEADINTGMLTKAKSKSNMEGTIQAMMKVVPIEISITKEVTVKQL